MAGNTITNILPKILAAGLLALREAAVMPHLVNTDHGTDAAQHGNTIDVPVPKARTAADVTAAPTYSSAVATSPGLVQVALDQWKHNDMFLTDKQMVEIDRNAHFMPMETSEAVRALANVADVNIHSQYTGIFGFVGTANVIPFSTVKTATDTRKVLNEQLCPVDGRNVVLDPAAEAGALGLSAFSDVEKTQDRAVKIEGELGRKFGMGFFMSQNVQTHTAGTLSTPGALVASTTAAGSSSIGLKSVSTSGHLVVGDIFTIAGQSTTYVVKAAVSAIVSGSNAATTIDPPLSAIATAAAAVTIKATHVVNLAFHRNAFAFATRPLMAATSDVQGGNQMVAATDPITGLSLRLEVIRQYKQVAWDFDLLYGSKLIRPQLAVRIAG